MPETFSVVVVYPDLLGTYGDGGNGRVLKRRLENLGASVTLHLVNSQDRLPRDGDFYIVGGGEDGPQGLAAHRLIADGALAEGRDRGAVIFGICAGFQLLGDEIIDKDGESQLGLGLVSATTKPLTSKRAIGEVLSTPSIDIGQHHLSGFENHGFGTTLSGDTVPLGRCEVGVGNTYEDVAEGAVLDRVVCTYLHGPVLARNPGLVDYLIRLRTDVFSDFPRDADYRLQLDLHHACVDRASSLGKSRRNGLHRLRHRH